MSSYLNFYIVPKKSKKKYHFDAESKTEKEEVVEISKGEPVLLMSISRADEVYQAFNDTLNPPYFYKGNEFSELTYDDVRRVVTDFEKSVKSTEDRLKVTYKMMKESGYHEELFEEIMSFENYLSEQKETLSELKSISSLVYNITEDYTDIEKILINVG